MKNKLIFAFTIIIASLGLNSCEAWEDESYHPGGDSDEEVIIPGNWKLTELNLEEPFDFNQDGTASINLMTETNCYQNELMSFLPNNTGISTSNSYANITVDDENFTVECIEETEETPFTWSQTETSFSIVVDGNTLPAILAGNKITFTIPEGFMAGSVETLQDITFIYTKQ